MKRWLTFSLLALVGWVPATGLISETAMAQDTPTEVVVGGLYNPCGVAVQPETGTVFVADSGHLKVVRIVDGKAEDVITDFGTDIYGKGPKFQIGPLGLAFLDKDTLVVGGGGHPDGEEFLYSFTIPAAGEAAIKAADATAKLSLPPGDEIKGEGNFYGVAVTDNAVFVTCNGDDTKGWVSRAKRDGNTISDYERFLATKEAVEVDAPVAVTIDPKGNLLIGQMGEITIPEDGLITYYNANSGELLTNFEIGLSDITGLAFSPKTGQLYAIDFSWFDTSVGGLFHLVRDDNDALTATANQVVGLDKPTAMAFGPDGSLYITVVGTGEGEDTEGTGQLIKIAPGL